MGESKSSGFRIICLTAQFFFGGWFLAHGLNHWLEFFPRPSGSSSAARELIGALNHSGIFIAVKALEVVTGVLLLANRAVPLAATLAMPITLSIAMLNILGNMDTFSIGVGIIAIALNGLILLGHLDAFLPMLAWHHGDPDSAALARLAGEGMPASTRESSLKGFGHMLAIAAGIAAPVLVTFWSTSDSGFRSKDHYRHAAEAQP